MQVLMSKKNLENIVTESEHLKRVFSKLDVYVLKYVGAPNSGKNKLKKEVSNYLTKEFPSRRQFACRDVCMMYVNEKVRRIGEDGLPIKEACTLLRFLAADHSLIRKIDPQITFVFDTAANDYIESEFSNHPYTRKVLRDLYNELKKEY